MFGKLLAGIMVVLIVVVAVVLINTLRLSSLQKDVASIKPIDIDEEQVANHLAEAIRLETVSQGAGLPIKESEFSRFHRFLLTRFPLVHKTLSREVINNYSLLYTWEGSESDGKPILIAAHMDVVPIEDDTQANWTYPPFEGVIADGYIWGRGAMDMKSSLTGVLEAVEYLINDGFAPTRTIYLAFGHDEEVGGPNGAAQIAKLLKSRNVRLEFTLDEGLVITKGIVPGVDKPAALIGLAEKGLASLKLTATGKGGHSSMPPPHTSVGRIGRAVARIEDNPMPTSLALPATQTFEYLAPEMSFLKRAIIANRWLFNWLLVCKLEATAATNALIRTTITPTMINGGVKENVVPQKASATLNVRLLPGDDLDGAVSHIKDVVDDPKLKIDHGSKPASDASKVSDEKSSSFAMLHKTVLQVFPDVVVAPGLLAGRTDSRYYQDIAENSYRFLPMRLGPTDLKRIHGTDERISVSNYTEIIRFYVQLLTNSK